MRAKGFTLIETLVALIILTGAFAVVWNWFGASTISTTKIEQAIKINAIFDSFMERFALEPLNDKRSGSYRIEDYIVRWKATPEKLSTEEPFRRQQSWVAVLFKVQVAISNEEKTVAEFETKYYAQWPDPNSKTLSYEDFLDA